MLRVLLANYSASKGQCIDLEKQIGKVRKNSNVIAERGYNVI